MASFEHHLKSVKSIAIFSCISDDSQIFLTQHGHWRAAIIISRHFWVDLGSSFILAFTRARFPPSVADFGWKVLSGIFQTHRISCCIGGGICARIASTNMIFLAYITDLSEFPLMISLKYDSTYNIWICPNQKRESLFTQLLLAPS